MSSKDRALTEADLHAYVDGQLDATARATVETHLRGNPQDLAETESWRSQNEMLRALYGPIADEAPPARLGAHRLAWRVRASNAQRLRHAAAALVLLTLGIAGGWYGRDALSGSPAASHPLADEAMAAHGLYAGEVVHPVEVRAAERDHLRAWLSKRLDRTLTVPDLTAFDFNLVGGRLLPSHGGPAAQFMYENAGGLRVTLYIVPAEIDRETSFRFARAGDLEASFWTDDAIECALVGELPRQELGRIAAEAYRQLG